MNKFYWVLDDNKCSACVDGCLDTRYYAFYEKKVKQGAGYTTRIFLLQFDDPGDLYLHLIKPKGSFDGIIKLWIFGDFLDDEDDNDYGGSFLGGQIFNEGQLGDLETKLMNEFRDKKEVRKRGDSK